MDSDKTLCNSVYETSKPTNLESNLIKSECLKRTLEGFVSHESDSKEETKSVQDEKVDVSPEISNKRSNDTSPMELEKISDGSRMNKSFSLQTFTHTNKNQQQKQLANEDQPDDDPTDVSKNMAFVIDFGNGKQVDEQRHKNLLERFQSRHRRGVSLSKVEDEMGDSSSSSQLTAKLKSPASAKLPRRSLAIREIETPQKPASAGGVRLRDKTKATQLKDASKRHSWSPRSSVVEPITQPQKVSKPSSSKMSNPLERPLKLHALSKADVKPMPPTTLNIACLQTPLENKNSQLTDDQVSEAGTYTLDGDNYTEEQKEKMNIDKLALDHEFELMERKLEINESDSNVETDLEVIDLDVSPEQHVPRHAASGNRKNILEVSFYHQEPTTSASMSAKHKTSYLEKLKSRVKHIGDSKFHKSKSPDDDLGKFTSVTTSGVLSIKPTLELNPRLKRKNSLTKSQIDSSEYVQGIQRTDGKGPITDSDKSIAAGYQLNIFTKQSPSKSRKESVGSSNTSISTAATKDDWIQEWARNAREFSHQKRTPIAPVMSSSYNFEGSRDKSDQFGFFSDDVMTRSDCKPQYEEFGDNLEKYHQKNQHHKKPPTPENHHQDENAHRPTNNLSNQGSLSSARGRRILRDFEPNKEEPRTSSNFNIKPPISPSRIPSPIGSVSHRQKRFGSNAMLYGSETDLTNDTELYLQRTAAAISTLQNLQRRNSLRNSSLQNSPVSPLSPTRPPIAQSNSKNPTPAVLAPSRAQILTRNSIHKRNSSLDSSRFSPANVMSSSLQSNHLMEVQRKQPQQQQQQHSRHNSYDGMLPPQRPSTAKYSHFDQTDDDDYESMPSRGLPERQQPSTKHHQPQSAIKQQQQSPIKRSSSFNVKPQESPARVSAGTPKLHNKFTKTYSAPAPAGARIQKSASSSCFKQMSSRHVDDDDYDNEFYINDDDDLNPNQLTPSEGSDEDHKYSMTNDPPITNTRYNKTFLMRCEQNKKAANGLGGKALGVVACPNTPEMPRRNLADRSTNRDRASITRDSSLSRLQDKKPLSAGSTPTAKAAVGGKVTSKYLDISKYKSEKGGNFLKRDESKSYLNREVKKSSSSACLQNFQRDLARTSGRSSGGGSRPSSGTNKKKEVKNTKEAELAMWKRRASYDPLKAAAEGKKKAEEAKRQAQYQQMMMSSESNSSALRSSKSFHYGTTDNWIDDDDDDSSSDFDDDN